MNPIGNTVGKRFVFNWTCPSCGKKLHFSWPEYDRPRTGSDCWLCCEGRGSCRQGSRHIWNGSLWEFAGGIHPMAKN